MITVRVLDKETGRISREHKPARIDRHCAEEKNVVWVDVQAPGDDDLRILAEEFKFHPLSIEDVSHAHQRPKVEEYRGYYFIVVYEARRSASDGALELAELGIFLGKNYVVTVHREAIAAVATVERLWPEWLDRADKAAGSGMLAYLLIDTIVDDYLPILDDMSDRMDDLEDKIFGDFDAGSIEEIFLIKKELVFLRRAVAPLRDVFNTLLRREQPIFEREIYPYFQDVFDHLIRVADNIDSLRDLLGSTMDAYLSISGNRMNVVMKRLTSISTILMSVTLIAGIYGMNFEIMPELRWRYGYVVALLSMVGVGLAIYAYLRRIDWL
jgi:magnesium transporter